jgi:hypothetical protein
MVFTAPIQYIGKKNWQGRAEWGGTLEFEKTEVLKCHGYEARPLKRLYGTGRSNFPECNTQECDRHVPPSIVSAYPVLR